MLDFLSNLFDGLSGVGSDVWGAIKWLAGMVTAGFAYLGSALMHLLHFVLNMFGKVGGFLSHIWNGFFKRILGGMFRLFQKIHQFLATHLKRYLDFVRKLRAMLDRYYKQFIRPTLVMIEKIRRVLLVFRLLHLKFAIALDRKLAQLEAKYIGTFLQARGYLNEVIGFVNALADPLGILKLVMLGVAGRRQAAAMVRIFTGLPIGVFFPNTRRGAAPWEKPISKSSQLLDPRTNPPPSELLAGVAFDTPTAFMDPDPIPTDAELDAGGPNYIYDSMFDYMAKSEAVWDGDTGDPLSIVDFLQTQQGTLADAGAAGRDMVFGVLSSE